MRIAGDDEPSSLALLAIGVVACTDNTPRTNTATRPQMNAETGRFTQMGCADILWRGVRGLTDLSENHAGLRAEIWPDGTRTPRGWVRTTVRRGAGGDLSASPSFQ